MDRLFGKRNSRSNDKKDKFTTGYSPDFRTRTFLDDKTQYPGTKKINVEYEKSENKFAAKYKSSKHFKINTEDQKRQFIDLKKQDKNSHEN